MLNVSKIKNRTKKGVTPVIATIILIAGTLVLALVVGAYTFGLFGSNVKTITLSSSTTLYSGSIATVEPTTGACSSGPYLYLVVNNPGGATGINSVVISSGAGAISTSAGGVYNSVGSGSTGTCTAIPTSATAVGGGATTSFYLYFNDGTTGITLGAGQLYSITVTFANQQSQTLQLTAQ
jgi:flagellin-like protein